MNWADCSKSAEAIFAQSRFSWPTTGWEGFNCETGLTVTDVTGGIAWIWTYPGDAILRLPAINSFFELSPHQTGGALSGVITLAMLWVAMIVLGGILDALT